MFSILRSFLDEQQATLITLMVLSIPLSFLLRAIQNRNFILLITITCSIIFQLVMFDHERYFLWAQQQIVYLLLRFAPRNRIGSIVMLESFVFLAIVQFRRMYISYAVNGVDITGILMMQTFLYGGLAYNYENGLKSNDQLTDSAIKRKVQTLPDYTTYIGYVFFLPACLVGPVFQFRDFEDYLNRKGDYQNIPSTVLPTLLQFRTFIISITIYVATMRFDLWYTINPQFADRSYIFT